MLFVCSAFVFSFHSLDQNYFISSALTRMSVEVESPYLTLEYSKNETNTVTLKINGENHTLANILTERFDQDRRITYSAYKVPHPLTETVEIKVTGEKEWP